MVRARNSVTAPGFAGQPAEIKTLVFLAFGGAPLEGTHEVMLRFEHGAGIVLGEDFSITMECSGGQTMWATSERFTFSLSALPPQSFAIWMHVALNGMFTASVPLAVKVSPKES